MPDPRYYVKTNLGRDQNLCQELHCLKDSTDKMKYQQQQHHISKTQSKNKTATKQKMLK